MKNMDLKYLEVNVIKSVMKMKKTGIGIRAD